MNMEINYTAINRKLSLQIMYMIKDMVTKCFMDDSPSQSEEAVSNKYHTNMAIHD